MPANAGIQVRLVFKFKTRLDSGFRRNDGKRVDFESTNSEPLGSKPRVVQWNHSIPISWDRLPFQRLANLRCYLWRGDRPHEFGPVQIVAYAIEQPLTAGEQRRHEVDLHLIQSGPRH